MLSPSHIAGYWITYSAHSNPARYLLDRLIRAPQQRRGNGQPERPRGLEIDDQLELGGLLDGQVGRLGAFEAGRRCLMAKSVN